MSTPSAPHPAAAILSLFSAGDLPFFLRLRTGRHVRECAACEQQVLALRAAHLEIRRQASAEILTGFEAIADWHSLEAEMLGNIKVGVAAARCIEPVGHSGKLGARLVWAVSMTALFFAGWMARVPTDYTPRVAAALRHAVGLDQPLNGTVVRSTPDGITVRAQGSALTILHPQSAVISLSSPSSVTARYVDDDSGQVTITNVYGQ